MAARCLVGTYQIKFGVQILAPTFLCGLCLLSLCLCVFSPGTLAFFHIQICPAIAWEGASPACTLALTPSQLGWVFFIMDYFLLIICANSFYSSKCILYLYLHHSKKGILSFWDEIEVHYNFYRGTSFDLLKTWMQMSKHWVFQCFFYDYATEELYSKISNRCLNHASPSKFARTSTLMPFFVCDSSPPIYIAICWWHTNTKPVTPNPWAMAVAD